MSSDRTDLARTDQQQSHPMLGNTSLTSVRPGSVVVLQRRGISGKQLITCGIAILTRRYEFVSVTSRTNHNALRIATRRVRNKNIHPLSLCYCRTRLLSNLTTADADHFHWLILAVQCDQEAAERGETGYSGHKMFPLHDLHPRTGASSRWRYAILDLTIP